MLGQTFSASSLGPGWLNSEGHDAHPALPEVTRRPLPGRRLAGLGHLLARG
jgi:hypothetical protein